MISKVPYLVRKYYSHLVWKMPTEKNEIFLTFDDGPTPGITDQVLDLLKKYNAEATFFCLGKNASNHAGLFKRINLEGHAVGNHSMTHLNGWKVSSEIYLEDVEKCNDIFRSKLFRPPYGKIRRSQASGLLQNYRIIMWSVLTRDYDPKITKEECVELALSGLKPGYIIVFHDSLKAADKMLYSLEILLMEMKKKGFVSKGIY